MRQLQVALFQEGFQMRTGLEGLGSAYRRRDGQQVAQVVVDQAHDAHGLERTALESVGVQEGPIQIAGDRADQRRGSST
ncbi:hypothetical protein DPM13_01050 [Paracoccus mutanolyticus]|uniref:Uncharacterized protein n=1 Tax=Paracoccus mutanolyticus TaxID=1499308 RepID=A0ABN5MB73_9RHOB|nr:hypothetical protein [Paracoccus mutanolyticus]AWX92334.1 hypothetical protein DPM13_01050 [Paracoccus mutanolyticus]